MLVSCPVPEQGNDQAERLLSQFGVGPEAAEAM